MKVNLKSILSFIEGNYKFYKNKIIVSPEYIREQIYYRLYICKDDCLVVNVCKYCDCPPKRKSWITQSCNNGERFPDIMNKPDWEEFKKQQDIKIDNIKNE